MTTSWFSKISIRAKLLWVIMLTSSIALIIAGLSVITYDAITFKRQRLNDLTTQAEILGAISSAAVAFNDAKSANEYLSALKTRPMVSMAIIYDSVGKPFATYRRNDSDSFDAPQIEPEGNHIEDDTVELFRHVKQGNDVLGTVYIRASLGLQERRLRYTGIVLVLVISSLLIALILSAHLQALVSEPLLEVADIAQRVIDSQDYSRRAIRYSDDEVGVLVDAFNQMLTQIQQREAALQSANQALQAEIAEHRTAREQVAALNETLEQRVVERTAELEAANKELESFSYSVSHDLRAPLRGIDGFSLILQENYADQLDAKGKSYLQRVRAATQRMGDLIDDLLKLSRATRSEMNPSMVNLSELATTIANELQEAMPTRKATFVIDPNMIVNADPTLMQVMLENLIGNAWKFSSKRPETRIEIGKKIIGGETAYYIKDNGTGFDMKYADKLFGAFQRLHTVNEFEGTGVGLANVQRIVRRHGGNVWAEATPDEGATFYFTLPAWRKSA